MDWMKIVNQYYNSGYYTADQVKVCVSEAHQELIESVRAIERKLDSIDKP